MRVKPVKWPTKKRLASAYWAIGIICLFLVINDLFFLPFSREQSSLDSINLNVSLESNPKSIPLTISGLTFNFRDINQSIPSSEFLKHAADAFQMGGNLLRELQSEDLLSSPEIIIEEDKTKEENCLGSIFRHGWEFKGTDNVVSLPCGLKVGSQITVAAIPRKDIQKGNPTVESSQFVMELQALKAADGQDKPRIFHFNPRLEGDFSGMPVIELNSLYKVYWASPLRCTGQRSEENEATVDGMVKCEKWTGADQESKNETTVWPYPFSVDQPFVLTLSVGPQGYHVSVDGRHIASFPHRRVFGLEDATGFSLSGDIKLLFIAALSLPYKNSTRSTLSMLEMSHRWQAPKLTGEPVDLFIGIFSAGNNFAERMAVRKSWMQFATNSSRIVARFFVALHSRRKINALLKTEAEFYGDIVIVPFKDSYDLVVLKTVAICDYMFRTVPAKYILKCDDDTFVRVDAVLGQLNQTRNNSLYLGNINYGHYPEREGKWAVTYEEWPDKPYPPYANGAAYVISSDIARFIVSAFQKRTLALFKMEDVSMGIWVELFNMSQPVDYVLDYGYSHFGCGSGYFTAHYQSPRDMLCLWNKLQEGKAECCD